MDTVNDLINAWGVYEILGVLVKALIRYETFIRDNVNKTNKTRSLLPE